MTATIVYFITGERAELLDDHGNGWVTVRYVRVQVDGARLLAVRYVNGRVADRRKADITDRFVIGRQS